MPAARFIVHGKVQGVFYRASARDEALRLGLNGHAINLPDGCVEVVACGDAAALETFRRWLRQGPPAARVEALDREELSAMAGVRGFRVG